MRDGDTECLAGVISEYHHRYLLEYFKLRNSLERREPTPMLQVLPGNQSEEFLLHLGLAPLASQMFSSPSKIPVAAAEALEGLILAARCCQYTTISSPSLCVLSGCIFLCLLPRGKGHP